MGLIKPQREPEAKRDQSEHLQNIKNVNSDLSFCKKNEIVLFIMSSISFKSEKYVGFFLLCN